MTEEEAKACWCPFARSASMLSSLDPPHKRQVSANRVPDTGMPDSDCLCLASGCMAWRWDSRHKTELDGYCGLAGKP